MYDENNPDRVKQCRRLNDELRMSMGRCDSKNVVVLTIGIRAMGDEFVTKALDAIRVFKDFNKDNDPYLEHDVVSVSVDGAKVMAKIDYFDNSLVYHSPNKVDPAVTKRMMTIMLASEY